MIRAIVKSSFQTDHRVACKHALFNAVAQTLFNCGEEVLRHGAADNFLGENEIVALAGLEADEHIAELTVSAGLLLVSALNLDLLADGLSVCDLRHAEIDLNAELVLELGNDNIKVLLAETGENLLAGLFVNDERNCRILFEEPEQARRDLLFVALLADFDCHGQAGGRELDALEGYRVLCRADRVAGLDARKLCDNADVTRGDAGGVLLLAALEGDYLAHSLALFGAGVISGGVRSYLAGNDLEEGHLADERVGDSLEADSRKRAVFVAGKTVLACLVGCGGSGIDYLVKEHIDSFAGVARAGVYGDNGAVADAGVESLDYLFAGESLACKELLHQLVVARSDCFCKYIEHLVKLRVGGHCDLFLLAAAVVESLAGREVDICRNLAAVHIGDDNGADSTADCVFYSCKCFIEICIVRVAAGDGEHSRNASGVRRLESFLCADVKAGARRSDDEHAVRRADAFAHAARKVKKTGSVDYIYLRAVPLNSGNSG